MCKWKKTLGPILAVFLAVVAVGAAQGSILIEDTSWPPSYLGSFQQSGTGPGGSSGMVWYYNNINFSGIESVSWGPRAGSLSASMDGSPGLLTFLSINNDQATWTGSTTVRHAPFQPGHPSDPQYYNTYNVPIYLYVWARGESLATPIPWTLKDPALVDIDSIALTFTDGFNVNNSFKAWFILYGVAPVTYSNPSNGKSVTANYYYPLDYLFDALNTYPGDHASSSVGGQFYHTIAGDSAIPEPATCVVWLLLGAVGVTYGWLRRRKSC
jgi:hypothetical protein